ncbi:DUF262 domain-containing protein [Burkholderia lata]|uniref:DUF262 domain-containing protein n=1 Tax=Burkholderia lata (strain ATCC 17760 / DSM 23089 / LMG 22485 / NCIMB 9086 / R18194 / 383) TaxID=482957 RepID=UPI0009F6A25B|nr:DUF262 domain-containing protein [Burkholderia lata]
MTTPNPELSAPDLGVEEGAESSAPYGAVPERKVLIQQYDYAVRTLVDMVTEGDLVLDPDYQRQYRWTDDKASRFIESIALNIPVPVLYLAEETDGTFTVIDGQQRLTSLFRFLKPTELATMFPDRGLEELVLDGLKVRSDMNRKRYLELDRADRSVLGKRPIRCIVVLNESDSTLKFEVFERLNTGSASLTDQEVRNCIYRGSFNSMLKRLATNAKFQSLISLPDAARNTMKDVELVLRFFAYREFTDETNYSDNYSEYLNNHMEYNREISSALEASLTATFEKTVDLIYDTLGPGTAFRRPENRLQPDGSPFGHTYINGAIYESQMVAVSKLVDSNASIPADLKSRIFSAFAVDQYWNSIFQGTSKKAKVLHRSRVLTEKIMG